MNLYVWWEWAWLRSGISGTRSASLQEPLPADAAAELFGNLTRMQPVLHLKDSRAPILPPRIGPVEKLFPALRISVQKSFHRRVLNSAREAASEIAIPPLCDSSLYKAENKAFDPNQLVSAEFQNRTCCPDLRRMSFESRGSSKGKLTAWHKFRGWHGRSYRPRVLAGLSSSNVVPRTVQIIAANHAEWKRVHRRLSSQV